MIIKNLDTEAGQYCGKDLSAGESYEITEEARLLWATDDSVLDAIDSEKLGVVVDDEPAGHATSKAMLLRSQAASLAVDKGSEGPDQTITANDWEVIDANRVIWDIEENYDLETNDFVVPYSGIYFCDGQWQITDMINVSSVEVAVFKREENETSYWFILDKKEFAPLAEVSTTQMSAGTNFDFYEGERYTIKIKITGLLSSAKISYDDDFTAWGFSFIRQLYK